MDEETLKVFEENEMETTDSPKTFECEYCKIKEVIEMKSIGHVCKHHGGKTNSFNHSKTANQNIVHLMFEIIVIIVIGTSY